MNLSGWSARRILLVKVQLFLSFVFLAEVAIFLFTGKCCGFITNVFLLRFCYADPLTPIQILQISMDSCLLLSVAAFRMNRFICTLNRICSFIGFRVSFIHCGFSSFVQPQQPFIPLITIFSHLNRFQLT